MLAQRKPERRNYGPATKDQINNDSIIQKFCYNNDSNMCNVYGGLYQWRQAMLYSTKRSARGICPIGWHIPSPVDFNLLIASVGGDGNALKKVGQGQGTNSSGFSGLLSGINNFTLFGDSGVSSWYWNTDSYLQWEIGVLRSRNFSIWSDSSINMGDMDAAYGLSIRCLKDSVGLLLQSPYGGEKWLIGSNHKIIWGGDLNSKKIKIDYTTDNGSSWQEILSSISASEGDYNWIIPHTPSKNCKVRVTDINNSNFVDLNDLVFSIIQDPCSGKSIVQQEKQTYNTTILDGKCWLKENVNIGTMIPGNQLPSKNGAIEKYCYNDDTANCNIYGGLYTYTEMQEPDICPTFFHNGSIDEIAQSVLYDANSLKAIGQGTGFGSGTNATGFSLLLSGFRRYNGTFQSLGKIGYFPFSLSGTYYGNIIYDLSNGIDWTQIDNTSGGSLRCVRDEIGPLSLRSPVGGENWLIGSTKKISWTLSDVINIKIDYTTDNGSSWINITPSTPTSVGSYNWKIPNTPSTNCKVRISSVNSPDTSSISNNVFHIYLIPVTPCPGLPNIIYDHQTYNTVAIGDQCWLKENLNIGSRINGIQNQIDNGIIEKYCYNDDTANCTKYGGLYLWNEAMQYDTTAGAKGICPIGWHTPTWTEFAILETNVNSDANNLLSIGQGLGNNSSGFSALLTGARSNDGSFVSLSFSTEFIGFDYDLSIDGEILYKQIIYKDLGLSVRCVNDLSVSELPVELTTFTSSIIDNQVRLNWNTATETNTSSFEIEKKISNTNSWQNIASIKASGNSTSPKQYSYTDKNVNSGKYNYRLKMIDLDGSFKYSNVINVEIAPPAKCELSNAYPNPWNPTTKIKYQVPENILVIIKVFDALGKEVSTLVNEIKSPGIYEVTFNGKGLSSGVYYYQMKAGSFIDTKKITLLK